MNVSVDVVAAQLPAFVVLHSPDGRLVWVNRVAYGVRPKDVLGKPSDVLIHEEDRTRWWDWFRRCLHLREVHDCSVRVTVPAPPGWARLVGRMAPVVSRGKVRGVVTLMNDATLRAEEASPLLRFLLTPLERDVVRQLLASAVPLKGAALARRVGEAMRSGQASSKLRVVLGGLCDRGVLEHVTAGYQVSAAFRPHAAALAGP